MATEWWEEHFCEAQRLVSSPALTFCIQPDAHGLITLRVKNFFLTSNLSSFLVWNHGCFKKRYPLTFTCAGPQTHTSKLPQAQVSHDNFCKLMAHGGMWQLQQKDNTDLLLGSTTWDRERGLLSWDISQIFYKAFLGELTLQRNTFTTKHLPSHIIHLNLPVAFSLQACVELWRQN